MRLLLLFVLLFGSDLLCAKLNLIKKESAKGDTTLLVIGGIHGNEPGGYFAAALLASHYTITQNNLWIVPNLNAPSIVANRRGLHGDMNRKFSKIASNDKDKPTVEAIKKIILQPRVSLVLNLHDGHGFYRKKAQGSIYNPNAWGQTCVIDQCKLKQNQPFGNLNTIARSVKNSMNTRLLKKHHSFDVKNTNTKYDDEAMQLSLTYFCVTNNKPAFAIETSKNLPSLAHKVFYQLLAIEEFMKIMHIQYKRDFDLNAKSIKKLLKEYGTVSINDNIMLPLSNIKSSLSYIPLRSNHNSFTFSHPLGSVKKISAKRYALYIGNRRITTLNAQYFQQEKHLPKSCRITVDNKDQRLTPKSILSVRHAFRVHRHKKMRVNVIGFWQKGRKDESEVFITLADLQKRYAIDKANTKYRVEFYRGKKFCFMVVVDFQGDEKE